MGDPRLDILIWLWRATRDNDALHAKMSAGVRGRWLYRHWREVQTRREIGFRYRPVDWFGDVSPAEVKRLQRASIALEKEGLLERIAAWDDRVTHLKLTQKGCAEGAKMSEGHQVAIINEHGYLIRTVDASEPVDPRL